MKLVLRLHLNNEYILKEEAQSTNVLYNKHLMNIIIVSLYFMVHDEYYIYFTTGAREEN